MAGLQRINIYNSTPFLRIFVMVHLWLLVETSCSSYMKGVLTNIMYRRNSLFMNIWTLLFPWRFQTNYNSNSRRLDYLFMCEHSLCYSCNKYSIENQGKGDTRQSKKQTNMLRWPSPAQKQSENDYMQPVENQLKPLTLPH